MIIMRAIDVCIDDSHDVYFPYVYLLTSLRFDDYEEMRAQNR